MPITIYISTRCSNCNRLMGTVKRIPSLSDTRIVDIDRYSVQGIEYVPTLVDDYGTTHIGSKAFEYLKKYQGEIQIDAMEIGTGRLAFGSLDDDGELNFTSMASDFSA